MLGPNTEHTYSCDARSQKPQWSAAIVRFHFKSLYSETTSYNRKKMHPRFREPSMSKSEPTDPRDRRCRSSREKRAAPIPGFSVPHRHAIRKFPHRSLNLPAMCFPLRLEVFDCDRTDYRYTLTVQGYWLRHDLKDASGLMPAVSRQRRSRSGPCHRDDIKLDSSTLACRLDLEIENEQTKRS